MRVLPFVVVFTFLVLVGCSKSSDPVSKALGISKDADVEETTSDVSTDYNEVVALNLLHTGSNVSSTKNNSVFVKGTGTKSTYKISYKFNSAEFLNLKILETTMRASIGSACDSPEIKLVLKNKLGSQEMTILDQPRLVPYADYILEVVADNAKCSRQEFTFDLMVWVGSPEENAEVAIVCSNPQSSLMTFFPNGGFVTAFDAVKAKFLDSNMYCGVKSAPGSQTGCYGELKLQDGGILLTHTECSAKSPTEMKSFSVDFDRPGNKVSVSCKDGETESFADIFNNCEVKVLNYKQFEK